MAKKTTSVGEDRRRGSRRVGSRGWRWLESTEDLQREAFGHDWEAIGRTPANQAASLRDNLFASLIELAETAREFSWKSWATDEPFINRRRVINELVDVMHFVANMLVTLNVDDDGWAEAYQAKQQENRDRQQSGYAVRDASRNRASTAIRDFAKSQTTRGIIPPKCQCADGVPYQPISGPVRCRTCFKEI